MNITYRKFSDFPRGTMLALLKDSYAFDSRYERDWLANWQQADQFFYDHPSIADACGFITCLDGVAIGFICWDPRNAPAYVAVGHNCIATKHKGKHYGKGQLQEAVGRTALTQCKKIIVTTDQQLIPAQRNYASVGFRLVQKRVNEKNAEYAGMYLDYEMVLRD